jgi:hypothetical protein
LACRPVKRIKSLFGATWLELKALVWRAKAPSQLETAERPGSVTFLDGRINFRRSCRGRQEDLPPAALRRPCERKFSNFSTPLPRVRRQYQSAEPCER